MNTRLDEIRVALKCLQDIDNIKLPEQWFAIAFNRILYTNFAPEFMWDVLLYFCRKHSNHLKCYIGDESFFYSNDIKSMEIIDLSEQSIAEYLLVDFRFTRNHVLLNSSEFWVVRLDQDVTYFLFHVDSWEYISELLGGLSNIENFMLNDFDGIKGQSGIVENYVSALLQNIKHVAV